MEHEQLDFLFNNSIPVNGSLEDKHEIVDLAGYQVTKAELFSHTREPAITIWQTRMKFNMACLRKFPGIQYIQILIHPEQKRLIIRPCESDAPDSLRWATGGEEKELKNRDLLCKIFAGKLYDLMDWKSEYRYKILGKPVTYKKEVLFLFQLSDFELFVSGKFRFKYVLLKMCFFYLGGIRVKKQTPKVNSFHPIKGSLFFEIFKK